MYFTVVFLAVLRILAFEAEVMAGASIGKLGRKVVGLAPVEQAFGCVQGHGRCDRAAESGGDGFGQVQRLILLPVTYSRTHCCSYKHV